MTNSPTAPLFLQLRYLVIGPTLAYLGLSDPAATNLLLGTAAQESGFRFLAQYPTGPARGIYQIEPATHHDLLDNFVKFHPDLVARLSELVFAACDRDQQLTVNLSYATAIEGVLRHLKGRFILSLNNHPEVRRLFGAYRIEAVTTTYTIGAATTCGNAGEVIISSVVGGW